jgi:hypothetical protein
MLFINPQNEYPRHIGDLQLDNPGWKVGDPLPAGWQQVEYASEIPTKGADEILYEVKPSMVNGKLTQTFALRPMTAEEKAYRDAPKTAKAKLLELGLTEIEIDALIRGLLR